MTDTAPGSPPELGVVPDPNAQLRQPSLTRNSAARFLADIAGLVFGVISGVITARGLGPTGKGLFSTLTLLASILMWVCCMGLGDAAIVMVGQKRATIQQALSVTITAGLCLSCLGAALLWGSAILAFENDWGEVRTAAIIACGALPISVLGTQLGFLLSAQERVVAHSAVAATTAVMTSVGLILFIGLIPLSIAGGIVANLVGAGAGLGLAWWCLRRSGLSFRPRFDRGYLFPALRYGMSVAVSYVVTLMFLRVDLLLTYSLAGPRAAGHYSVALALSGLVSLLPVAISSGTFPRLTAVDEVRAQQLVAQASRYGVAAALTAGLILLAAVPVGVPVLFGRAFAPAVGPALILLVSSILWSSQWVLSRAHAARGQPGLLLGSFLLGLVVMCGMDFFLIPRFGITGTALAAVAGPAFGLLLCLFSYHRSPSWTLPLSAYFPRARDFRGLITQSLQLLPVKRGDAMQPGDR
jgi:O-antigen/teichoic acid export membrane protein